MGPLAIRWRYLPRIAPWLLRYLASGFTAKRVERTARALRTLLVGAPALHKKLATEAGVPHLIEQAGVMHVFPSRADFEAASLAWAIRRAVGVTWLELSAEEIAQREPALDRRYTFGLLVEEAGRCRNPGGYVAALADHARSLGAVFMKDEVADLRIVAGRLTSVVTVSGGEMGCDRAVIAAGARSKALAAMADDRVPLETERGYHVMVDDESIGLRGAFMASDAKIIVSAMETGIRAAGQVELAGLHVAPDWRRAEILRDILLRMLPGLPRDLPAERIKMWFGHRPSLPDGMPVIGPSRATPDIVHAFGHGHVGLVSSARTGRLVAQLIDGRQPEIDLAPFSPARFR